MFNRIKDGMYWDRAWKLVEGCTPVSEGCANCWSARETHVRANHPNGKISTRNRGLTTITAPHPSPSPSEGRGKKGEGAFCSFNGKIRLRVDNLGLPLRTKKPTAFAIWNDLFHEDVPSAFIFDAFETMWTANQHLFFILTKRPEKMKAFMELIDAAFAEDDRGLPENVWLGVTAENQEQADKRIPLLLQTPAAHRYVSIEPMLSSIVLPPSSIVHLDWVICGGESGPGARPMHPDWPRSLRDQCVTAGVPYFFKQFGEWKAADDPFQGLQFTKTARARSNRRSTACRRYPRNSPQRPG